MKVDKAPEKIVLSADKETGELYDEWVVKDLTDNIKIEYVRKDVFIEKVVKYLKDNVIYIHPRKGTKECIVNIPKFIDYMKEE